MPSNHSASPTVVGNRLLHLLIAAVEVNSLHLTAIIYRAGRMYKKEGKNRGIFSGKATVWRAYNVRRTVAIGVWSLVIFLFYALVVYLSTMSIIGTAAGYDFYDESLPIPLWLAIGALIPVLATTWPVQRWIRRQVTFLMAWEEADDASSLVTQLTPIETAQTAEQLMLTLVQQLAAMLDAPYVAIETAYASLAATSGERSDSPLRVLPLQHGGETIGQLLIAPREVAGMPVEFNDRLLADVARQVSLTLWAAQLSTDLQASRLRIVTAREEARRQLLRDLHDGLGAGLASITLQADTALDLLPDDPQTAVQILESLIEQSGQTTRELRRIIDDLRPAVLDDVGLHGALHELLNIRTTTEFELIVPATLPALPAAVEIALYRIAQEATTNIIKHAGAKQAILTLELSDQAAILTIEDDGPGLLAERSSGVGLHSMRERAEELGGTLVIQSNQPRGCRVTAEIPL
jgi:signal transduction histidine kinase